MSRNSSRRQQRTLERTLERKRAIAKRLRSGKAINKRLCDYGGKVSFGTRDEALAEARFQVATRKVSPMRAYRCPNCGAWHLTSRTK